MPDESSSESAPSPFAMPQHAGAAKPIELYVGQEIEFEGGAFVAMSIGPSGVFLAPKDNSVALKVVEPPEAAATAE